MMKFRSMIGVCAALCCLVSVSGLAKDLVQSSVVTGTVTKSVDGDTVNFRPDDARSEDKDWKIRMIGIDAPETHFPVPGRKPVGQQPWGDEAGEYMEANVPVGSRVTLVTFGKDRYGRVLGRVEMNGNDINLELVEKGLAIPYIICDGNLCDADFYQNNKVDQYFAACKDAVKKERGMFRSRNPLNEMPFEFRLRMQKRTPDKYVGNYETKELVSPANYKQVDLCSRVFFLKKEKAEALGYREVR